MYEAIRLLSIVKEEGRHKLRLMLPKAVEDLQNNMGELSEMAQIRNLHWWTVEYGLIGTGKTPKFMEQVYCHLSASAYCMTDQVKKIPMISPRLNKVLILQNYNPNYT
jgi:phenylalanine-4-hydroxylase